MPKILAVPAFFKSLSLDFFQDSRHTLVLNLFKKHTHKSYVILTYIAPRQAFLLQQEEREKRIGLQPTCLLSWASTWLSEVSTVRFALFPTSQGYLAWPPRPSFEIWVEDFDSTAPAFCMPVKPSSCGQWQDLPMVQAVPGWLNMMKWIQRANSLSGLSWVGNAGLSSQMHIWTCDRWCFVDSWNSFKVSFMLKQYEVSGFFIILVISLVTTLPLVSVLHMVSIGPNIKFFKFFGLLFALNSQCNSV